MQPVFTINPTLLIPEFAPTYNHFDGTPFESFLVDDRRELILHPNWRAGLIGRALEMPSGNSTFGERIGALDQQDQPTLFGKKIIQWGSWFIDGDNLATSTADNNTTKWEAYMRASILESASAVGIPFDPILTLKNLAILSGLKSKSPTHDDWEIITSMDLTSKPILGAYEVAKIQPGYWGKRKTSHQVDHYNETYGAGNWAVAFRLINPATGDEHVITTFQFAERVFQRCLQYYFQQYPEQLQFIAAHASELYEEEDYLEDDIGMGYDLSSYKTTTKYQFAIIRRFMLLNRLKFDGDRLIAIRGARREDPTAGPQYNGYGGIGRILHPGAIAIPNTLLDFIPPNETNIRGWWNAWEDDPSIINHDRFDQTKYGAQLVSLEQAYHRSKCIIVKKHSGLSTAQQLSHQ